MLQDTITAIATPLGEGSIAVIRISGDQSIEIVDRLFRGKQRLSEVASHTVHYGYIMESNSNERIDEVLVTVMKAPRSYTMENIVEISCHGGIVAVKKVLEQVLQCGARLAEPGEFTKRAFLNGRIDLAQAEAVMDMIRSKSDRASSLALKQVEGMLSKHIRQLRDQLVSLMAHIEVNIDYPEHDVEEMTNTLIKDQCTAMMEDVEKLLHSSQQGKVLREGIVTAIVGKPNVGKSSLLNMLIRQNKAIVTDIPGTTRDVIEEFVTINGIPLRLLDTAGIRETQDLVEQIGVERSKTALSEADLVLLVLNYNEALSEEERALLEQIQSKQMIIIVNKTDLAQRLELDELLHKVDQSQIIKMSVLAERGLDDLEKAIHDLFFEGRFESDDMTYVSNVRHIHLLKQAKQSLRDAYHAAEQWVPIDMIQIDLRNAWEQLGEVIGDAVGDSLLDQIFSQFCLGK